jgi:hypothetical protein
LPKSSIPTKRFADATEEMRRTAGSIKASSTLPRRAQEGVIEMRKRQRIDLAIRRAVSTINR